METATEQFAAGDWVRIKADHPSGHRGSLAKVLSPRLGCDGKLLLEVHTSRLEYLNKGRPSPCKIEYAIEPTALIRCPVPQ